MVRLLPLLVLVGCLPDGRPEHTPHADIASDPSHTRPRPGPVAPPPPLRAPGDAPDVTVYGYWPYWGDPLDTLPWDQLTHVAIFSVGLQADGSLSVTERWTDHAPTAVQLAQPWGVRVHLTVTSFDDAVQAAVLPDPTRRATAIANLAALVQAHGGHGVNVDFEGVDAWLRPHAATFVEELAAAVDEVYVAMPAVDWSDAWDEARVGAAADGLFLMAYDYHWRGGAPGPVAPLFGGGTWSSISIAQTVADYRAEGVPDDKLVLGLPLYGYDWPTTSTAVPGTATGAATARFFAEAGSLAATHGRSWDAPTATPYTFPSTTRQLWYDDTESVEDKVAWGVGEGLAGVGFWALTYDDGDVALWTAVDALTHLPDPTLRIAGLAPGAAGVVNTVQIVGATPWQEVHLLGAASTGPGVPLPGCPGVTIDLRRPRVVGSAVADASGYAEITLSVPPGAAGRTFQGQLGELATCRTSDVAPMAF